MTRVLLALLLALPACFTNSIIDEFSTEMTIPDPGDDARAFEIRKRYRFSQDPQAAEEITLAQVTVAIATQGEDLSFVQRVVVYAELEDETRVPVAIGEGFLPGETSTEIEVLYHGDLKLLVRADQRLVLVWAIEPSSWYRPFPDAGIDLYAKAVVEIVL